MRYIKSCSSLSHLFLYRLLLYAETLTKSSSVRTVMPKPLLFCFCCAVSLERWCRLRGNLLFYFKSREQWSEPLGVIILEQCTVRVDPPSNHVPYGFSIGKYCHSRILSLFVPIHCYNGASMTFAVIVICMYARGFNVACVTRSKAQRETCYSFRRRLVSTVRRQHGRGTGQLVASIAVGQLRVHAKPIVIIATAHRGFQRTQARH